MQGRGQHLWEKIRKVDKQLIFKLATSFAGKIEMGKGSEICVSYLQKIEVMLYMLRQLKIDISVHSNITDAYYEKINLAARKFRYHRACMDNLMNMKCREGKYTYNRHQQAFLQTPNEISESLLKTGVVYSLSRLTTQYRQPLQQLAAQLAMSYRTHNMKKPVISPFWRYTSIFKPQEHFNFGLCFT